MEEACQTGSSILVILHVWLTGRVAAVLHVAEKLGIDQGKEVMCSPLKWEGEELNSIGL